MYKAVWLDDNGNRCVDFGHDTPDSAVEFLKKVFSGKVYPGRATIASEKAMSPDDFARWQKELYGKREFEQSTDCEGPKKPACECGGDKARTTHSTWCPKFGGEK